VALSHLIPSTGIKKFADRLGVATLVSVDKNLMKLVTLDPLLLMDAFVVFKSPEQASASNYSRLGKGQTSVELRQSLEKYRLNWKNADGDMLDRFQPRGREACLDFEQFSRTLAVVLLQATEALAINFDHVALHHAIIGHSVGGNPDSMRRVRENGGRIAVQPLPLADIPIDHARWINEQADVMEIYDRLQGAASGEKSAKKRMAKPVRSKTKAKLVKNQGVADPVLDVFPIKSIQNELLPGMFAEFSANASRAATALVPDGNQGIVRVIAFYEWLAETFDGKEYARIQRAHLNREEVGEFSNELKYLDAPYWTGSKIWHASSLGLHEANGLDILDIGTGPGHFQLVAQYLGHKSLGMDIKFKPAVSTAERHIYDDLCEFFGVEKIDHRIMARQPLPPIDRKFDLVTSFMSFFAMGPNRQAWSIDDWKYFITDLRTNYMKPDARLYLTLTQSGSTPETWPWLAERATESREKTRVLNFTDMSVFD
jgi:hypothetical protein